MKAPATFLLLYLSVLTFTINCSRPSDNPNTPPPAIIQDSTLLRQFISLNYSYYPDTVFTETYLYDINKRLTTVITISQQPGGTGGPISISNDTLTYYYNSNDTLAQQAIYKTRRYSPSGLPLDQSNYTFRYGYDNTGRIIADTMTVTNLTNVNRYVYVSNTQITQFSKTLVSGSGGTAEVQTTINLGWQGNNLISEVRASSSPTSYQFTYDTKVFPFNKIRPVYSFIPSVQPFSLNTLWSLRCSKNNPTQTNITTYTTGVPITSTVNYTYQYRTDGYPIKVSRSSVAEAFFLYY